MPKVSQKQAAQAFAKYQVENLNDDSTIRDVFISWLEADTGAFDKYVDGNTSARPLQSLESFRIHASSKPISQETQSWDMALERLSPEGLEIIRLCAYLNPDNVPRSLLEQMITEDLRDKVLSELRSQSLLINADNEGLLFRINGLLQETVRRQLARLDNTGAIAKAIVEKGAEALKTIIGNHETTSQTDIGLFWKENDCLNLQIASLIAEGEKIKISETLLATLLEWSGEYQEHISLNFVESLTLYQRSLAIRKVIYSDNHPDIAMSLFKVGGIYYEQEQYYQALEYFQQALAMRQVVYGDNHPAVARSLRGIGNIYGCQDQYIEAISYYERALVIYKTTYGDQHPDFAATLSNMGSIYAFQEQYSEALDYYHQALATYKVTYAGTHTDVALSQSRIDKLYEKLQEGAALSQIIMGPEKKREFKGILARLDIGDRSLKEVILEKFGLGDADVQLLVKALPQSRVTNLNLSHNKIWADGAISLAKVLTQSQITSLNLKGNSIGDKGAMALAEVLIQSQVTSLNLSYNKIWSDGAISLAKVLAQSKVTSLDLEFNNIWEAGAVALAQVLAQSQVTILNLGHNKICSEAAISLAKVLAKSQVTDLNLGYNSIGDAGAAALAEALPQSKVTNLNLWGNDIGDEGAVALAQVLPKSQVTSINLSSNGIGGAGAAALANVLPLSQVTSLSLYNNDIDGAWDATLSKLMEKALPQSQSTVFDFSGNWILEGPATLEAVLAQSQVTNLDLSSNKISVAGAMVLAKVLPQSKVTSLNLYGNDIGDVGVAVLAQILEQSQITSLNLKGNSIGDKGAMALAEVLIQSQVTSLNLSYNKIWSDGAISLAKVLAQSKVTSLDLEFNNIWEAGAVALAQVLAQSQVTSLNLGHNNIGEAEPEDLEAAMLTKFMDEAEFMEEAETAAQVLPQSQTTIFDFSGNWILEGPATLEAMLAQSHVTNLDLLGNKISVAGAIIVLAKVLPQSKVTSLNLYGNNIADGSVAALAQILAQSQITSLNLGDNSIGDAGAAALAQVLIQSQVTSLNLSYNKILSDGAISLAKVLPQSHVTNLDLEFNNIWEAGAVALAQVLAQSQVTSLNLRENIIGEAGAAALLQAVKLNFTIQDLKLGLDNSQESILNAHLTINKLLNCESLKSKAISEFIQELESGALVYIRQPKILDDTTLKKPKRLLLKAMDLGSVNAIYLLGNLYLNEFKNLTKAKEYYLKAASTGHAISKLCLELIEQGDAADKLELGDLTINLPHRFSASTAEKKLALREHELTSLGEPNALVSKTGISLAALNELQNIKAVMNVYVATEDYEPIEAGYLHFNQGQTIYIKHFDDADIKENFANFTKEALAKSFIPYNRDTQGRKRAEVGFIPYDMYLNEEYFQAKPRGDWSAEDVCNAIITPKTKPSVGEKSKPYVDILPSIQRGKAFEGYILSYARSTKFADILRSLNEHFKKRNFDDVFIWIDLAGINQHAWMEMDSSSIGKILEVNLTQLFTYVSDGRLIHFDKARPTNLTRSWCLVELLSCLKAQENTVAQTEICMSSEVQSQVLAQDLIQLLNALDSSKAQCFNPQDKIAIDAQINRALTNEGEAEISMDEAYAKLNAVVKSWLVTKFLPDFSNIDELKKLQVAQTSNAQEEEDHIAVTQTPNLESVVAAHAGAPLTLAYDSKKMVAPNQLSQETDAATSSSAPVVAARRGSRFEALLARFQPRAKNNMS